MGLFSIPGQDVDDEVSKPGVLTCGCGWSNEYPNMDDALLGYEIHLQDFHGKERFGYTARWVLNP